MATVNLGSIKFKWKGTYAGGTAYTVDDVVSYNGSSYICILASTGNLPTNATYFEQMSSAGTNGTDGTDLTTTLTTQGDIVYRDGSGLQRLGAGTSGQALLTGGTGANPSWGTVASNVDIVSHTTLDGTGANTITTTTDWSTNNYYKMEIFFQYAMNASQGFKIRLRNASGDISTDSYQYFFFQNYDTVNHTNHVHAGGRDLNGSRTEIEGNGWGYNSNFIRPNLRMTIYKPDTNNRQFWEHSYFNSDTSNPDYYAEYRWSSWCNNTDAKKGWSFYGNSGANFINSTKTVIGYKYQ
jgi:hypothetical protein